MPSEILDNRGQGVASWNFPPVHPEGRKFAVIAGAVTAALAFFGWDWLAWPMAGVTIWVLAFFRDPPRVTPRDERLVIAPADGLITLIEKVAPPPELRVIEPGDGGLGNQPVTRVSIFMSVFDVHINRSPVAGIIRRVVYIPGKFLNAELDKASEDNERQHFLVEQPNGTSIGFTQIAGLVARRILPFVAPGEPVTAGQRIGLIRFGSRVDVYLPEGTEPSVVKGQRSIAGETVLAAVSSQPLIEGTRQ